MRRIFVIGLLLLLMTGAAFAQDSSGQFCVRSYEDVNANGLFDTETERLITRGVSVELLDASGVVVGSAMLDKSPNASYGIICFYNLGEGQYSVLVSSADYIATTDRLVSQTVSATAPTIIEFGARRLGSLEAAGTMPEAAPAPGAAGSMVMRMGVSAAGAAVIMVLFMLTGFIVFGLRSRSKPQQKPVRFSEEAVRTMEPVPPVQPQDTPTSTSTASTSSSEYDYAPPPIQEPPISDEDTNPTKI